MLTVIDDDALPAGHDWALLEFDGCVHLVIKRSRNLPHVIAEAERALGLATGRRAA